MHDPRLTPARPDLAAKHLQREVKAARFVRGEEFEIAESLASLRAGPSSDAVLATEVLKGERVIIYDRNDEGWAWGQLKSDGYVGWLPASALVKPCNAPTHKVTALRTFAFPGPSIKLPPAATLVMGTMLEIMHEDRAFAITHEGWHVPRQHIRAVEECAQDFVAVAEQFVGTPYLWGGKSSLGIDCSGLVQVSLNAAGISCPRDSDMQQDSLGQTLQAIDSRKLHRGDLIFWKGHVAIVRDARSIVHANAHHMATVIEPTVDAVERIKASGLEIASVRRLELGNRP